MSSDNKVELTQTDWGTWQARAVDEDHVLEIYFGADTFHFHGYVVRESLAIVATVVANGISVGPVPGNLKDGLKIIFELKDSEEEFRFYLKHGNELWVTGHGCDYEILLLSF
ncbi:hypothetical protein BDV39DRAFT_204690 [Aspergillus sergii]|uniref:Uncharacterized protein n=1 Tax=Aspergillus sergii TaxID=1034303 RepID=A0A5N6X379_9EURO|nr:hypothetical protein BDV39DRAFT_204690 [Aspergillus sergii]